jgi:hypothetical protein
MTNEQEYTVIEALAAICCAINYTCPHGAIREDLTESEIKLGRHLTEIQTALDANSDPSSAEALK